MLLFYMLNEVNQVLKYTCVSNQVLARRVLKFIFYPLEALICSEYGLVGSGPEHRTLIFTRLVPIRRHLARALSFHIFESHRCASGMGLRPRLATCRGRRRGATSLGTISATTTSRSGARARQTDAGALPPPAPDTTRPWATTCSGGDATCSSSSG